MQVWQVFQNFDTVCIFSRLNQCINSFDKIHRKGYDRTLSNSFIRSTSSKTLQYSICTQCLPASSGVGRPGDDLPSLPVNKADFFINNKVRCKVTNPIFHRYIKEKQQTMISTPIHDLITTKNSKFKIHPKAMILQNISDTTFFGEIIIEKNVLIRGDIEKIDFGQYVIIRENTIIRPPRAFIDIKITFFTFCFFF